MRRRRRRRLHEQRAAVLGPDRHEQRPVCDPGRVHARSGRPGRSRRAPAPRSAAPAVRIGGRAPSDHPRRPQRSAPAGLTIPPIQIRAAATCTTWPTIGAGPGRPDACPAGDEQHDAGQAGRGRDRASPPRAERRSSASAPSWRRRRAPAGARRCGWRTGSRRRLPASSPALRRRPGRRGAPRRQAQPPAAAPGAAASSPSRMTNRWNDGHPERQQQPDVGQPAADDPDRVGLAMGRSAGDLGQVALDVADAEAEEALGGMAVGRRQRAPGDDVHAVGQAADRSRPGRTGRPDRPRRRGRGPAARPASATSIEVTCDSSGSLKTRRSSSGDSREHGPGAGRAGHELGVGQHRARASTGDRQAGRVAASGAREAPPPRNRHQARRRASAEAKRRPGRPAGRRRRARGRSWSSSRRPRRPPRRARRRQWRGTALGTGRRSRPAPR